MGSCRDPKRPSPVGIVMVDKDDSTARLPHLRDPDHSAVDFRAQQDYLRDIAGCYRELVACSKKQEQRLKEIEVDIIDMSGQLRDGKTNFDRVNGVMFPPHPAPTVETRLARIEDWNALSQRTVVGLLASIGLVVIGGAVAGVLWVIRAMGHGP